MSNPGGATTSTTVYVGGGSPAEMGNSSGYVGFFGTTPIAQKASTNGAAVATTQAVSTTSNIWGFSTSTQANNVVTMVNDIYNALKSYGLLSS